MNKTGKIISPKYKDIIPSQNYYIVKNENGKYSFIDQNFNKIIDEEYDYIDISFMSRNIFICANYSDTINIDKYGYVNTLYTIKRIDGADVGQYSDLNYPKLKVKDLAEDNIKKYNDIKEVTDNIEHSFILDKLYETEQR